MADTLTEIVFKTAKQNVERMIEQGRSEEEIVDLLTRGFTSAVEKVVEAGGKNTAAYMRSHMYEVVREVEALDSEFIAHLEQKWGRCFVASRVLYVMATEASQMFSEFVKDKIGEEDYAKKQYTYLSLQHLHGRACQEYLEILALMRGGFADGAFARWRSLYELACVASFIEMHGEAVAEQFFEQADSERRAYKWAESVLDPSGRPVKSFAQVQTMCEVAEEWSEYYSDACLVTHASPQGTFGRIANGTAANIIPVGRSDYGLQVPGRLSATILQWITGLFLTTFPHIDSIANVRAITEMAEDIQKMYYDTHQEVFKDLIEEEQTDGQEGPRFEGT